MWLRDKVLAQQMGLFNPSINTTKQTKSKHEIGKG